jgi:hypothetical protein
LTVSHLKYARNLGHAARAMPAHREHYSPAAQSQHKLTLNTSFFAFRTG